MPRRLCCLQEAAGDAVLSDLGDLLPTSYAEIFPFTSRPDTGPTG